MKVSMWMWLSDTLKCESEDLYNGWTSARTDVEGETSTSETGKQGTYTM